MNGLLTAGSSLLRRVRRSLRGYPYPHVADGEKVYEGIQTVPRHDMRGSLMCGDWEREYTQRLPQDDPISETKE